MLVYINQGALFALAFDPERLTPMGTAVAVLDDVAYSSTFGFAHIDIARNGTLVYRRAVHGGLVVSMLDDEGGVAPLLTRPGNYTFPGSPVTPGSSPWPQRTAACSVC